MAPPTLLEKLLGTTPRERVLMRRTLLATTVYLVTNILRAAGWLWGDIPRDTFVELLIFEFCGVTTFLTLQRSGWSNRFADPTMTLAQICFALSALTLSYALLDMSRGATLQIICLILAFGMYRLSPTQIFLSGLFAVSMLVATLIILDHMQTQRIDIAKQTLNIALAAVILPVLSYIGQQVSLMRRKQIQQREELSEALRRLEELAMRDALTGLVNRRCIMGMLDAELKRSQRTGQRFCLAMLDIDFFKRVNDNYGHQAGDAVLIGLAQAAAAALRNTDVIARWGGEEFLLMLTCTTAEFAQTPLTRLCQGLADHNWNGVLPADEKITLSVGLAEFEPSETLDSLIARADQALYAAKSGGRNRITVATHGNGVSA